MVHAVNAWLQITAIGMAGIVEAPAGKQDLGALLSGKGVIALDVFLCCSMNHRARKGRRVERLAYVQPIYRLHERVDKAVRQLLRNENAAGRNATLARRLERTENRSSDSKFEPGILTNDDRAFAAHFAGDNAIGKINRQLLDAFTDGVAARKQHDVDVRIAHQCLARRPLAVNQVDRASGETSLHEQLDQLLANGWGIFGGLENHRVAFQKARPEHPERNGKGEIPGGDHGRHAPGFPADVDIFFGDLRGQHVSNRHSARPENILDHVQAFDHLRTAFAQNLAAFARHESSQRVGLALDDLRQVVEQLGAVKPAGAARQVGKAALRGGDGFHALDLQEKAEIGRRFSTSAQDYGWKSARLSPRSSGR